MCKPHWRMVPRTLQRQVWATYRPGQCDDKSPSEAWLTAADAAIQAVWDQEMRAIQLSHSSVEHYGPAYMGDLFREVFGGPISLDPASCPQANLLIRAEHYYTQEQDGLSLPWFGSVYLNPPGGRVRYQGKDVNQAALWWATLVHRYTLGHVHQAGFMVFNLELFRYAQGWNVPHPVDFPICYPQERIDFYKPGPAGAPVPQGSPGHPNAVIYLGPHVERFQRVFRLPRGEWPGGKVKA